MSKNIEKNAVFSAFFYAVCLLFVVFYVLVFRVVFHIKRQRAHAMSAPKSVQKSDTGIA